MKRDGARDAVVGVYARHLHLVEPTVLIQELALDLDGLAVSLLLGAYAQQQPYSLRLGAVRARHGYSSSDTNSDGSTSRALAILRMVEGYAVPVLSIRESVSFDTSALSPSSRRLRTRFLRRALNLRTFTSTWAVYIISTTSANNEYDFQKFYQYLYTKLIRKRYTGRRKGNGPAGGCYTSRPGPQRGRVTVDEVRTP